MPIDESEEDYTHLLELAFAFWRSQVLFAALDLDVFGALGDDQLTAPELMERLEIHGRGAVDFLEALVRLNLLVRDEARYRASRTTARFLDRRLPSYMGATCEFIAARLSTVWTQLGAALRSGCPQNEASFDDDYYANLCADAARHGRFLAAMDGLTTQVAKTLASRFPWERCRTFIDAGGGRGALAVALAERHPHLTGTIVDLPAVAPHATILIDNRRLEDRLTFRAVDFFHDPLPSAEVVIMGNVLHNWGESEKRHLIHSACKALPDNGALIVHEWFLDNCYTTLPAMMSLNMLLVTSGGRGSLTSDCETMLQEAGFARTESQPLFGPTSMVVGWKRSR